MKDIMFRTPKHLSKAYDLEENFIVIDDAMVSLK